MSDSLREAVRRIAQWMRANEAAVLADNLAPGATDVELQAIEARFGYPLPPELRALWAMHHGQLAELNGFLTSRDLLNETRALDELDTVRPALESLREADDWATSGLTREELDSNEWVPFGGRDSDLLIIHARTGRVFACLKDWPPVQLEAPSLTTWFADFAARVEADDYAVEEGFGDCYLSLRDRKREAAAAARARAVEEAERHRRETPLLVQLRQALAKGDAERCREVFDDCAKTPEHLAPAVEALFASGRKPKFIATSLQFVVRVVALTADQWALVEAGGRALGNEAIVGVVKERAPAKPWWKLW